MFNFFEKACATWPADFGRYFSEFMKAGVLKLLSRGIVPPTRVIGMRNMIPPVLTRFKMTLRIKQKQGYPRRKVIWPIEYQTYEKTRSSGRRFLAPTGGMS